MDDLFIDGTADGQLTALVSRHPRLTAAGYMPPDLVWGNYPKDELENAPRQFSVKQIALCRYLIRNLTTPRSKGEHNYTISLQPPSLINELRHIWEHHGWLNKLKGFHPTSGEFILAALLERVPVGFEEREDPIYSIHLPFVWLKWKEGYNPIHHQDRKRVSVDGEPMWKLTPYWVNGSTGDLILFDRPINLGVALTRRPDLEVGDIQPAPPDNDWYRFRLDPTELERLNMEFKLI